MREALLGIVLVSLALAGCTSPAPPQEPLAGRGLVERITEPGSEPAPEPAPAPSPAGEPAPSTDAPPAPPPPADARGPAPAPANATADASAPAAPAPAAQAPPPPATPPPPPPPDGSLPTWNEGDQWTVHGVDARGHEYTETRTVLGRGTVAGHEVYRVRVEDGTVTGLRNVTVRGLDAVNDTGFVLELLRFPLAPGARWTFGWSEQLQTNTSQNFTHGVRANVTVLGLERTSATGSSWEAWHLHAEVSYLLGSLARTMTMEYWFAEEARAVVKTQQALPSGQQAWEELVTVRRASA
jgi:hypothetical protein